MAKNKQIYLDYGATTPTDPKVVKAMMPYFDKKFGNTMSLHSFGQEAKLALEESRASIASLIGAKSNEIIFTSSATESNNLALKGIAFANKAKGKHIIVSSVEHPCIIEASNWLEKNGFEISRLKVDKYGMVDLKEIESLIKKETILVSVMHANNEIGTIQPIEEIGRLCKSKDIYFHTDATQAFGKIPIDADKMNIDLLSASAHKLYGPKGVGLLFVREGTRIEPLLHGGGHEAGLRSATVNVSGIVGFAKTVELCRKEMKKESKRQIVLREKLINGVLKNIKDVKLNGHSKKRLPNNINLSFSFVEGESLLIQLDMLGVAVSTGSACSSDKLLPSHVLTAIKLKPYQIHGSMRFTLGRWTKQSDIDYVLKVLPGVVNKLREISPYKVKK